MMMIIPMEIQVKEIIKLPVDDREEYTFKLISKAGKRLYLPLDK